MKKILTAISTAMLIVILALAFAGCDTSVNITKAYEDLGYEITTVVLKNSDYKDKFKSTFSKITDEQQKEADSYELVICEKGAACRAIIVKFPSVSKLKEMLGEDSYVTAEDSGKASGNCYLLDYNGTDAFNTFKNAIKK